MSVDSPAESNGMATSTWNCDNVFGFGQQNEKYTAQSLSTIEQLNKTVDAAPGTGYSNGVDGKHYTLIFCRRKVAGTDHHSGEEEEEILLGMKKRGVGMGKWNGFGGKVETGESIEEGTRRELQEECGVVANKITKRGYLVETVKSSNMKFMIHVYDCWDFQPEPIPTESDEMKPKWFNINNLPWKSMWCDDPYWFPLLLNNISIFTGRFTLSDEETITSYVLVDHTGHVDNAKLKCDFEEEEQNSENEHE